MIITSLITYISATNTTESLISTASTVSTEITIPPTDLNIEELNPTFIEENTTEIIDNDNNPTTVIDVFNGRKLVKTQLNKNQLRNITASVKQKQQQQSQHKTKKDKKKRRRNSVVQNAIRRAALQGYNAMIDFYDRKEPNMFKKGKHTICTKQKYLITNI